MRPELSQRVTVAWDEVRGLGAAEADRYLRELRRVDPEVAGELDVLLEAHAPGQHERAGSPSGDADGPDPPHYAGPTVPEAGKGTADWRQPAHGAAGDGAPAGPPTGGPALGRYEMLRVVGRGTFGEVWQAYDPVLQKHVAVKAPLPGRPGRPPPPATFLQEARKAASIRHPAIVQVYDVGEGEGGWYIVSEFIEGESLRTRIEAGRPPFDRSARVIAAVAGALHAAHLAGLIHRDVKPANVLLDRAGNAFLTDFGLAVREDEQPAERSKVSGTLAYMSPEQVRGDTHLMDGRADIYALGAVLYELLTGRTPFRAEDVEGYREQILRREPRPPRSIDDTIPEELERLCLKCLAKEVRDRYPTAQDLANDLGAWLAAGAAPAPPPPVRPAPVPGWLKAAVGVAVGLSLLGAAIGVAVLSGALGGGPPRPDLPGPGAGRGRKGPTVRELVWPRENELCKWEVLPETEQLKVYAESTALLQLDEADADSWAFSATFRQLAPVGRIGLFLGHRKDARSATATFELIHLDIAGDKAYLKRSVEKYRPGAAFSAIDPRTYRSVPRARPRRENTIRITVRANRIAEVWFNDEAVAPLARVAFEPTAAGAFGVFNRNSDGVFSRLLFNGNPIALLADASPRSPEKP